MNRFCHECGVAVSETNRFCNKCGARLLPTQPASPGGSDHPASPAGAGPVENEATLEQTARLPQRPWSVGPIPPPPSMPPSPSVPPLSATGELTPNVAGMLCYPLSFLTGILFLVLSPYQRHPFVRFHAYQSIFFFVALFVLNIVLGIVSFVLPSFLEGMMNVGLKLLGLGGTAWLMYQAYLGNRFALPVIGEIAENQANKSS